MTRDGLRAIWRRARARYRARHPERCSRCAALRDLPGKWCSLCLAECQERPHPEKCHDRAEHARMLVLARSPDSRCYGTGLSGSALGDAGVPLTVDRMDPRLGYVVANMGLLAAPLNASKGRRRLWTPEAEERLHEAVANAQTPRGREARHYRSFMDGGGSTRGSGAAGMR